MIQALRKWFTPAEKSPLKVATIINFCTHDYRFLNVCIREASVFSSRILVSHSDHFFDGIPENQELLQEAMKQNQRAEFICLPYRKEESTDPQYWVTMLRWNAFSALNADVEYVLFLDADELVEGSLFASYLQKTSIRKYNIVKPSNYYYFRESCWRAKIYEDSVTLVRKNLITKEMVVDYQDRNKAWEILREPKIRMVHGLDGRPMIHHFSWVRTQHEMLRKVRSWGHAGERNWAELVREEFKRPFSGKDFVHGYKYELVEPPFPEIGL